MLKKITIPILAFIMFAAAKDNTISFNAKELENSLAVIPTTTVNYPPGDMDLPTPCYSMSTKQFSHDQKTNAEDVFYISKYEVSNLQYLIYVRDLLMNGKKEEYAAALPDSTVWRQPLTFGGPYREYYFRHPAYRNYPVVGVTYEQSKKYCEWLTQRYSKELKKKFPSANFKLPTVKQWYVAACGGLEICNFPWGGSYVRNAKGEFLANFLNMPEQCIYRDEKTNEFKVGFSPQYSSSSTNNNFADITAPVNSYFPNDYGLHNMAGNVEEFVEEKGITKGGSWNDPAYYLQNFVEEKYDTLHSASAERGFRFVMAIQK